MAVRNDLLEMDVRDGARTEANCFSNKGKMPSGPGDLNGFSRVNKIRTDSLDTSAKLTESSSLGLPHGNS